MDAARQFVAETGHRAAIGSLAEIDGLGTAAADEARDWIPG